MKLQLALLGLLAGLFVACENPHEDLYVYQEKVYTTPAVSRFEMNHFKLKGSNHIVLIDHADSTESKEKLKDAESVCSEYNLKCKKVKIDKFDADEKKNIIKAVENIPESKVMLISQDPAATAFFVGTYASKFDQINEQKLDSIYSELGLEVSSNLKSLILTK